MDHIPLPATVPVNGHPTEAMYSIVQVSPKLIASYAEIVSIPCPSQMVISTNPETQLRHCHCQNHLQSIPLHHKWTCLCLSAILEHLDPTGINENKLRIVQALLRLP
jgi:hypothetical protein